MKTGLTGRVGLVDLARPGDRITIRTRNGQSVTGRATIINRKHGCVVLNLGGRYGTPGIATDDNLVKIKRAAQPARFALMEAY